MVANILCEALNLDTPIAATHTVLLPGGIGILITLLFTDHTHMSVQYWHQSKHHACYIPAHCMHLQSRHKQGSSEPDALHVACHKVTHC